VSLELVNFCLQIKDLCEFDVEREMGIEHVARGMIRCREAATIVPVCAGRPLAFIAFAEPTQTPC